MRGLLSVLLVVTATTAHGAPSVITIRADQCPDAETVARSLSQLLPDRVVRAAPSERSADEVAIEIRDEGDRYRVTVAGTAKVISDPERRCTDRAHAAAVVAQLILEPPLFAAPEPVARARAARMYVDLGASAAFDVAPDLSSGGRLLTGGAHVRLNLGWKWIGATLGIAGMAPTHPSFGAYHYTLVRVPIDLGLYLGWRRRAVELGGEVGLVLAPLVIQGQDLAPSRSETRLEAGIRLRPEVRWWVRGWMALTIGLACDIAFRTYALEVNPVGQVGETPRIWTDVQLGLLFRLKKSE